MKIRIEWKTDSDQDRSGREYVTLDAKDIRRLCYDVAMKGEPYLIEVRHSDPVVPPDQNIKTSVRKYHKHVWARVPMTRDGKSEASFCECGESLWMNR